ncbi:hypothetical protein GA0115259_1035613 [Streptomyces sp. MnatMP-M17]|uniref:alpha/beta hydrolase n=1 Tax=Streptomyces sp. MnatMP-M17 TaxID=1839780 RepID=UPI00081D99E3|nr:hypothetical protein GA0115259_1035613 [Streptomyces sp. MnatMP-M17]
MCGRRQEATGARPPRARSGFRFVHLIAPRPLLVIVGREAVTSWMSVEAFQKARAPKELHWIDGASHVDLYDKEPYVGPAAEKLAGFFRAQPAAAEQTSGRAPGLGGLPAATA